MTKLSVRKEIERLNKDSKAILSNKNLPRETKFFIKSMLSLMEIIVAVLLEKKTRKNSSNSGLPPSSDYGSHGNRNKKSSSKKKDVGAVLDNSKVEVRKKTLSPKKCKECGCDLSTAKVTKKEDREQIDIEYTMVKTVITAETKQCPDCSAKTKSQFPEEMKSRFHYGIGIKSSIVNFLMIQMISLRRVSEHFEGLTGKRISESTQLSYVALLGEILKEDWREKLLV